MIPVASKPLCKLVRKSPNLWECSTPGCGQSLIVPDERHIPNMLCKGASALTNEQLSPLMVEAMRQAQEDPYDSPYACEHRGEQINFTSCKTCSKKTVKVPVYQCPKHTQCILFGTSDDHQLLFSKALKEGTPPDIYQCNLCPDRYVYRPGPFPGQVVRNLVYHIGAFNGETDVWKRNVKHLLDRWRLFNGKKVISIITGPRIVPPDKIIKEFGTAGDSVEWLTFPNNRKLREVVSFKPLFERVATTDPNQITFFAHSKGTTKPYNDGVSVHVWADIMYESCLDFMPLVEALLQKYPVAGSFKKIGKFFANSESLWHYSGTFYWFRNESVFRKPNWSHIDNVWWGTESWPSLHFGVKQAATIFYEAPGFHLYDNAFIRGPVLAAFNKWKEEHAQQVSQPSQRVQPL